MVFQEITLDEWNDTYSDSFKLIVLVLYVNQHRGHEFFNAFVDKYPKHFSVALMLKMNLAENPGATEQFEVTHKLTVMIFILGLEIYRMDGFDKKKAKMLALEVWKKRKEAKEQAKKALGAVKCAYDNRHEIKKFLKK